MTTFQHKNERRRSVTGGRRILPALVCIGVTVLMGHAQTTWAGVKQVGEYFNYGDGALDGRGSADAYGDFTTGIWGSSPGNKFAFAGSTWDSDWTRSAGSGLDFGVSGGALSFAPAAGAVPDASGNYAGMISRDFTLGMPGASQTFAATLTQVGGISSNYAGVMGFSDAIGSTARVGIKSGQFVMQVGDQPEALFGTVEANTPYTLVGQLQTGVSVNVGGVPQTGERLLLWVNESYERITGGIATPWIVESARGFTGLGSSLELYGLGEAAASGALTWDDLMVGTYFQDVNGWRHDFGPGTNHVQNGYLAWDVGSDGLSKSILHTGYNKQDPIVFDVSTLASGEVLAVEVGSLTGLGGVADALKRDAVMAAGELTLTIAELPAGDTHALKTYHHALNGQADEFDIFLSVDGGDNFIKVVTMDPSTGDETPAHSSFAFTPTEADTVVRFVTTNGGNVWLSGFEMVPEPSTFVLMIMGLMGLGFWNRRKKRIAS